MLFVILLLLVALLRLRNQRLRIGDSGLLSTFFVPLLLGAQLRS